MTVAVPVVAALVEVFKKTGLPEKFAPLSSLLLGMAYTVSYTVLSGEGESVSSLYLGIIVGLSASGLYSLTNRSLVQPIAGYFRKPH